MSQIDKPNKKPKYNNHDAFRWVDSQWEKFMTEQKELKSHIKQLQKDLGTCTKNYQRLREQQDGTKPYIYESPDGGKTIYRRIRGDYDTPRELVEVEQSKQLELFNE